MSVPCPAPWDGAVIHFSGIVYPCDSMSQGPDSVAMQLGDLRQQSLQEILEGSRAQQLRSRLLSGELDGLLCHSCDKRGTCNLYGDPSTGHRTRSATVGGETERWSLARLELGLTDLCNMRCTMCCLSRGEASPPGVAKNGMMDTQLALQVLEDAVALSDSPPLVFLHWVGEPLIHPGITQILQRINQLGARLHLVTNGIKLTEEIQHLLLSMDGDHVLNVSLNAWDPAIYADINKANTRDQVHQQLLNFLRLRTELGKTESWNVVASAVVLEQNQQDIRPFVDNWSRIFSEHGPFSIGLNGRGHQERLQIQILCELDDPLSPARFRQALRSCDIVDEEWPLEPWEATDQLLLGQAEESVIERVFNQLRGSVPAVQQELAAQLVQHKHPWTKGQLQQLLATGWSTSTRYRSALHRLAFHENQRLETLPVSMQQACSPDQFLLWAQLVPSAADELLCHGLDSIQPEQLGELAAVLHWSPRLAAQIPESHEFPQSADGSTAIIELSRGRASAVLGTPLPWQQEALAGLISCNERHHWQLQATTIDDRDCQDLSALIVQLAIDPQHPLPVDLTQRLRHSPEWQIRALRRRLIFAQRERASDWPQPATETLENLLLALLMSPRHQLGPLVARTIRSALSATATGHQDLAEVLASRPGLRFLPQWSLGTPMWREVLRCPALRPRPASQLAAAAVLRELGRPHHAVAELDRSSLSEWQQQQLVGLLTSAQIDLERA